MIVNNPTMDMGVQGLFEHLFSNLLVLYLGGELLGCVVIPCLIFGGTTDVTSLPAVFCNTIPCLPSTWYFLLF